MTFADNLRELRERATKGPWHVEADDRPGMSWNNHICVAGKPLTICFMAHEPKDNSGQQAAAEMIVLLANHAAEIEALVRAAEKMLAKSDDFVKETGLKHRDPLTDAAENVRKRLSALNKTSEEEK